VSDSGTDDSLPLRELLGLLEDVAAKAQSARPSTSEDLSDAEELGLALFVSTFEVYLGVRALLREGLAEEARMLSRTLLEDTARLIWLATSGEELEARALNFTYSSIEHERRLFRAAHENGYEWAEPALHDIDQELAVVKEEAERSGIELKKLPGPRDALHAMGYGELLYWHVKASQVIHSSRIGLSGRFAPRPEDARQIRIMLASPIEEVVRVGAMAIQTFSLAIVAANDVLGWGKHQELAEYRERMKRLSSDFFDRIARKGTSPERVPDDG